MFDKYYVRARVEQFKDARCAWNAAGARRQREITYAVCCVLCLNNSFMQHVDWHQPCSRSLACPPQLYPLGLLRSQVPLSIHSLLQDDVGGVAFSHFSCVRTSRLGATSSSSTRLGADLQTATMSVAAD